MRFRAEKTCWNRMRPSLRGRSDCKTLRRIFCSTSAAVAAKVYAANHFSGLTALLCNFLALSSVSDSGCLRQITRTRSYLHPVIPEGRKAAAR